MKFIVDAQLPVKLHNWLTENGFDSKHVVDLPKKEFTSDIEIIKFAVAEQRVIISKDSDFYKYFIINKKPDNLLMVTTGNITNKVLLKIFEQNFSKIYSLFEEGAKVVELNNSSILVH